MQPVKVEVNQYTDSEKVKEIQHGEIKQLKGNPRSINCS
jgi:hypothetical protein